MNRSNVTDRNKNAQHSQALPKTQMFENYCKISKSKQYRVSKLCSSFNLFAKQTNSSTEARFALFFLRESHFYGSVVLTSSHKKCEMRK